ncbi:unnamed protein product [Rhizophagus irregularis]|uniref:Uncharacterized protein n=1 Tax=Rhizophagus irregularis TaxID=588596 RepID=A0A915Z1R2_9GLOM|nr:unnamed protein product [Rhizophagus irregularis]CAB5357401.1 unnamed protein product [Rhizophagus irregularis]
MRVVEGRNDETYYKGQNVKLALMFSEAYLYGNNDDTNLLRVTRLIRLVRDFIGGLLKYTPDTLGIFVAPSGYTQSSLELAESADYDIFTT